MRVLPLLLSARGARGGACAGALSTLCGGARRASVAQCGGCVTAAWCASAPPDPPPPPTPAPTFPDPAWLCWSVGGYRCPPPPATTTVHVVANVYVLNGTLVLLLGRSDTWSGRGVQAMKVGRVAIALDPSR
eukprot:gene42576-28612_t